MFSKLKDENKKMSRLRVRNIYFCFGSGGLALLAGKAARPTFNAVAT